MSGKQLLKCEHVFKFQGKCVGRKIWWCSICGSLKVQETDANGKPVTAFYRVPKRERVGR